MYRRHIDAHSRVRKLEHFTVEGIAGVAVAIFVELFLITVGSAIVLEFGYMGYVYFFGNPFL